MTSAELLHLATEIAFEAHKGERRNRVSAHPSQGVGAVDTTERGECG